MTHTHSIIDIPDLVARRNVGVCSDDETRQEWLNEHYLGAYDSKEQCVAELVDDYDVLGALSRPTRRSLSIETIAKEFFETTLKAEYEGRTVHVFARH